ncbi:MAG: 5'/3'-nucleotidase SurE [Acidobacteriota bacterium]
MQAVAGLGTACVVAPTTPQSGASHAMSDRTPLRVTCQSAAGAHEAYAVDGRPADCVRIGLCHYLPGADWVLSGINAGGNLGVDVYYSGTVGAVREAAILGRPAVAVSQYIRDPARLDWDRSAGWAAHVIRQILQTTPRPSLFWNINLPQPDGGQPPAGIRLVPLAIEPHELAYQRHDAPDQVSVFHYRGRYQERPRPHGSDVDVVFDGFISVTPMGLDVSATGGPWPGFTPPPR